MKVKLQNSIRFLNAGILCGAALLLSACSVLQPVKPASMSTYAIDVQFEKSPPSTDNLTILVNMPVAQPGFNSARMVYVKKPHAIEYFTQNQWVDSPARMLTPLLVQALEQSSRYRAVVQLRSAATADLRLDTEIIRLQHEFLNQPSQVRLTMRVQLLDLQEKNVLATREFEVVEEAPSDDPYGGVIATNKAAGKILMQIAEFAAQHSPGQASQSAAKKK